MSEDFARKLSGGDIQGDDVLPAVPPPNTAVVAKTTATVPKLIKQGMKTIEATKSLK